MVIHKEIKIKTSHSELDNRHPKVAIIIPTYNRWPYVCEAIDSVLIQTYRNVEAVVIDDASTDGTTNKLRNKYGNQIRLISLKKNGEKSAARNAGICATNAKYVCMLDSDDLMTKNSVEDRMQVFLNDPQFCGVTYGLIQVNGRLKQVLDISPQGDIFEIYVKRSGFLNNNSFLLSKKNMLQYGMYNGALTNMEDKELLLRLTANLEFRCCNTVVQNVRRIGGISARSNYERFIEQGGGYIDIIRENTVLTKKLGPLMEELEFAEDKAISDAFYKAKRFKEYGQYSCRMFLKYGRRMWNIRFVRRHCFAIFFSNV